jgi:hypothetical protein
VEAHPVNLDPDTYGCPDGHCDLTDLVMEAVKNSLEGAFLLLEEEQTQPTTPPGTAKPFEVVVQCPGPAGAGQPHRVILTGSYIR